MGLFHIYAGLSRLAKPVPAPLLFIFSGESNSRGLSVSTPATELELSPRQNVKILDAVNLDKFQTLDIGTNNATEGNGTTGYNIHGMELQLANRAAANDLGQSVVYLVKTGQGSSTMEQWLPGAAEGYYQTFLNRVNAAKSLIEQKRATPQMVMFWSQGINNKNTNKTPVADWKAMTIAHFQRIKALYPNLIIFMTRFDSLAYMADYNAAMEEIAIELPYTKAVSTTGGTLGDSVHWDYAGMKLVANNMVNAFLNTYYK